MKLNKGYVRLDSKTQEINIWIETSIGKMKPRVANCKQDSLGRTYITLEPVEDPREVRE